MQIGNKDDMGAMTKNGLLAEKILDEYMQEFEKRNPTLRVFGAYLHMDEATLIYTLSLYLMFPAGRGEEWIQEYL